MTGKKPIAEGITEKAQSYRDTEIEYQLMAHFLRVNPVAIRAMHKEWFSDIILQDIFEVVEDLRITMSDAMILEELRKRSLMTASDKGLYQEVVLQIYENVDVKTHNDKNVRHMMVQILDLYESRRVLTGCGEIIGMMRDLDLDKAKEICSELGRPHILMDAHNAGHYVEDYEDRVEIMNERERKADETEDAHTGVPTGIYRFDKMTGGLMRGEFGFIAGITGVGKTAGLLEFGCNAWEAGEDVMIVSGEMSKELLEFRIDSRLTRINGLKFRNATLDDDDRKTWESTIQMYKTVHENILYIVSYPRHFNMDNVEQDIVRVEEETGRKLTTLCLDYVNILDPIVDVDGSWKDQSEAIWDFKSVVQDRELAGWTAGQVIDDAYDKELYTAKDIKYARAIGEAAPIIVALIMTPKDMIEKRMKFQVIKMRNAKPPTKPIALTPNLSIMRLHEEIRTGPKTLAGMTGGVVDEVAKTKKARPRKTLHGRT